MTHDEWQQKNQQAIEEMTAKFEYAIRAYVRHRNKYGGKLLPTKFIIDQAYADAMDRTGQRKK